MPANWRPMLMALWHPIRRLIGDLSILGGRRAHAHGASKDNTNTAMLVDHEIYPYGAYLGPYIKVPALFKCPADLSTAQIFGRSNAPGSQLLDE